MGRPQNSAFQPNLAKEIGSFKPGELLPPLSKLAKTHHVSPPTISRYLKALVNEGKLLHKPGSGFRVPYLGATHNQNFKTPKPKSASEKVRSTMLKWIEEGKFQRNTKLPKRESLAAQIGVNIKAVGNVLSELERTGVLKRHGKGWAIPGLTIGSTATHHQPTILLITRSPSYWAHLSNISRTREFIHSFNHECRAVGMAIRPFYSKQSSPVQSLVLSTETVQQEIKKLGPWYRGTLIAFGSDRFEELKEIMRVIRNGRRPSVILDQSGIKSKFDFPKEHTLAYSDENNVCQFAINTLTRMGHRKIALFMLYSVQLGN